MNYEKAKSEPRVKENILFFVNIEEKVTTFQYFDIQDTWAHCVFFTPKYKQFETELKFENK